MRNNLRSIALMGCLVIGVLSANGVKANENAEGTAVSVAGAVVVPTCDAKNAMPANKRGICEGSGAATNVVGIYDASVEHVSNAESDQLLQYLNGYAKADEGNASEPLMAVRAYE
jgi:hypothetical protein